MIEMLNCDCMEYMAGLPDKAFDLAIVDNIHTFSTISRMLQAGYQPFKTEARYFSETERGAEWFRQI